MSLEIIGAGFGRTGTASLRRALVILGCGPCYHMFEIRDAPWRARAWYRLAQGQPADFNAIFDGYRSAVDWPSVRYYRQLKEHYPAARFVLTVRDEDSWYRSTRDTIYPVSRAWPRWARERLPVIGTVYRMLEAVIWTGTFDGRFEDADYAKAVYRQHIEDVCNQIPAEDLLVFAVQDGWEPLCEFLGVQVPDGVPFPWVNEAAQIKRQVVVLRAAWWLTVMAVLVVVVGGGWWAVCLAMSY